jgi:predicted nucleotidyltransferase
MAGPATVSPDLLHQVAAVVVEAASPLRLILFGSAARGEAGAASDLDLLVVMPAGTHRRHTAMRLYRELLSIGFAVDLVVVTEADLADSGDAPGGVIQTALQEGRVLYAA